MVVKDASNSSQHCTYTEYGTRTSGGRTELLAVVWDQRAAFVSTVHALYGLYGTCVMLTATFLAGHALLCPFWWIHAPLLSVQYTAQ